MSNTIGSLVFFTFFLVGNFALATQPSSFVYEGVLTDSSDNLINNNSGIPMSADLVISGTSCYSQSYPAVIVANGNFKLSLDGSSGAWNSTGACAGISSLALFWANSSAKNLKITVNSETFANISVESVPYANQAAALDSNALTSFTGNISTTGTLSGAQVSTSLAKLYDGSAFYINLMAPSGLGSSLTFKFPNTAGTTGQVLQTDGSGNLSWVTGGGGGTVTSVTAAGTAGNPIAVGGTVAAPTIDITAATSGTNGYLTSTDWNTFNGKLSSALTSGNIFVGNVGNVATGVAMGGDATISNAGVLTLSSSGVSAGTYRSVSVDAKGRVTAGTNPTTLAGYGITDALSSAVPVPIANGGTGSTTGSIAATGALSFSAGGANQNVSLTPTGTGAVVLNGSVSLPSGSLSVNSGTVTSSAPLFSGSQTWNNVSTTFTAASVNVTDTASAATSKLLDLQVGGVSKFSVDKTGKVLGDGSGLTGVVGSAALSSITAATSTNTIDNLSNAQSWNWSSATTQTPMSINANALTWGSILKIASSSNSLSSTSGLLYVANTGTSTAGNIARIQANSTTGSGLTVLANGNVGIGTANPNSTLEVAGNIRMNGSTSGYVGFATAPVAGSTTYTWPSSAPASAMVLQSDVSGNLSWVSALSSVSPNFTGTPTAPTAAADTNSSQLATTAFVLGQAGVATPLMNGTSAAGVAIKFAREDHIHPTDTSRAPASGSASIDTLGTITTGTWAASPIGLAFGGTGASTAIAARSNLGLGTAATLDTGSTSGNIPQLGASGIQNNALCSSDSSGHITCNLGGVSSGNVGIGTSTPSYPLDVNGNINTSGSYLINGSSFVKSASSGQSLGLGQNALANNTGAMNTAMGYNALTSATAFDGAVAVGAYSMQTSVSPYSTAVGYHALPISTGQDNVGVGSYTLFSDTTGYYNVGVGSSALYGLTTGSYNTAVGFRAGYAGGTGSNNVLLGVNGTGTTINGNYNILIGYGLEVPSAATSSYLNIGGVVIGDLTNKKIGIGTTTTSMPSFNLSFGGNLSSQTIGVERNTVGFGQDLKIAAGGAQLGGADKAGGNLILSGGTSTGTGNSSIQFWTYTASGSGSTDNTPTEKMRILDNGNVGIGTTTPANKLDVVGNIGTSGNISAGGTINSPLHTSASGTNATFMAAAGFTTTVGDSGTAASSTVIQGGATGKIKIGQAGSSISAMGTCTVAAAGVTLGNNVRACTGVPLGAVVYCSPASVPTSPTNVAFSFNSTVASQINIISTAAVSSPSSLGFTCFWVAP